MMKSSFSANSQMTLRSFGRRLFGIGAGLAAVCFLSGHFAPLEAQERGRVVPLSATAQDTLKRADVGFAVAREDEQTIRSQGGSTSLLDSLQFMFKKDGKEEEKKADAEPASGALRYLITLFMSDR